MRLFFSHSLWWGTTIRLAIQQQTCSPLHPPPMIISSFNTLCSKSLALLVQRCIGFYWLRLSLFPCLLLVCLHLVCGEKFRGEARHFAPNHSTHPLTLTVPFCTQEQCPCKDNRSHAISTKQANKTISCQPPPQNQQPEIFPPSTSSTVSPRH